ncbi:MAG TPA: gamma carbonic anhydrase family protein [Aquifex sp.]|uniref:Gamma carbonic anhydrase family protein n=1 Tax=Aquifex aeolicus TaxID=63363 RepID=A0A9D1CFN2_AQUAO|nr:gamma carbonic anhydrase family protein [Aquifex sp.]HIP98302.1 gamma carbonic anhydrase family protein [Aquifex aeolicus]
MALIKPYRDWKPKIHPTVYLAENATVIGNVELGEYSSLWFGSVVRGDVHFIRIGKYSNIQDNAIIHVTHYTKPDMSDGFPTVIGDFVTVAHGAIIHGATIGNNVLVGIGAIVLDGAKIGDNTVIAAGSLVPPRKEFPPGVLLMGRPAQIKRELSPEEIDKIKQNALNYQKYAQQYLKQNATP